MKVGDLMEYETLKLATLASLSALWIFNCFLIWRMEDRINKRIEFLEKSINAKD